MNNDNNDWFLVCALTAAVLLSVWFAWMATESLRADFVCVECDW